MQIPNRAWRQPRTWEAWLIGEEGNVLNAVDISRFARDNKDQTAGAFFPPIKVSANDLDNLDRASRNWLTYWLLEIGTRGFEDSLAQKPAPEWLRWPG